MNKIYDHNLIPRLVGLAEGITDHRTTGTLMEVMYRVNELLGLTGSVFVSFAREDESRESYRFINTMLPAWCQEYNAHAWYTIDPCLLYSLTHNEPALIKDLPLHSRGQRIMMETAKQYGLASGFVIPAHSPSGRSRMGVLYLVSGDPDHLNESALRHLRLVLRALAGELLDWWTRQIRSELLSGGELSKIETEVLRMTHQGLGSKEIATHLGLTKNAVDQRLHRLTNRFDCFSRKDAANLAYQYGLL
jgi:DNA-binding CsgD family transcriptional regulator